MDHAHGIKPKPGKNDDERDSYIVDADLQRNQKRAMQTLQTPSLFRVYVPPCLY